MRGRLWRSVPSWWLIPTLLCILLAGGCSVPGSMGVRSGADPRHQDDNVRFRSTYYFRVFDVCRDAAGRAVSNRAPRLDSLYRFRMTGKASGLFSKVRFESGVLHKSEIDPFGATVVLDEKLGRPRFVSREETDRAARRNERYEEIERLTELLKKLDTLADEEAAEVGGANTAEAVQGVIAKLQEAMEQQVQNLFIGHREHAANVELLVRAKVNRVLAKDTTPDGDRVVRRLFDEMRNAPARGVCTVEVSRPSARAKASKQAPKNKRPARLAETTLRYEPPALPCPHAAPVALWIVDAREERPPAKNEALEWLFPCL